MKPAAETLQDHPADRAEATRQRILDVALGLFRTMGYQKTAVADIARELGMSPANVYRFFASKSAINEAIAAQMLQTLSEGAWAIARGPGRPPERMAELLRFLHRREVEMFFHEKRLHDMVTAAIGEHWGVVQRFVRVIVDSIRHVLMDGMASGDFARLDPERTALTIKHAMLPWNHPHHVAECFAHGETPEELRAAHEDMIAFVLRALRPDPVA
jgi:AcrR family transcriptional regulator